MTTFIESCYNELNEMAQRISFLQGFLFKLSPDNSDSFVVLDGIENKVITVKLEELNHEEVEELLCGLGEENDAEIFGDEDND
jgi:hypothetical protein